MDPIIITTVARISSSTIILFSIITGSGREKSGASMAIKRSGREKTMDRNILMRKCFISFSRAAFSVSTPSSEIGSYPIDRITSFIFAGEIITGSYVILAFSVIFKSARIIPFVRFNTPSIVAKQ